MIPISLSLEGLYSYQKKQTIDFSRLTGAQIFGIFGSTGSGKSSILEAITFALYGQSERLNQKDQRGYNMMNLRSDRLQIEFEFDVKDERYRFVAHGRRSSKDFEKVRTIERKAFKVEGEKLVPLAQPNAEELLGLSYDNFRRTIIIPQGKFMEFLQLSETDRTRMLKEIFHLQRFELANKVKSLNYKNNLEIEQKKTLLLELNSVSEAALAERQAEMVIKEQQLTAARTELTKLEKTFAKLESVKSLFEKIEAQQQKVADLETQKESFANREKELKEYEYALVEFKPLLDRRQERSEQLSQAQQELSTQKVSLIASENDLASGEKLFAGIEKQFQEREQYLQEAEEFEAIIEISKKAAIVQAHQSRIDNGKAKIDKKKQSAEEIRASILVNRQEIKVLKTNMPDVVDVIAVKGWFSDYQQINGRLQNAKEQRSREKKRLEELQSQKLGVLKETKLDPRQVSLALKDVLTLLEENSIQSRTSILETEKQITDLAVREQLKHITEALVEGDACPVCGSVHHPDKPEYDNLSHHLNKARTQLEEQQQAQLKREQQFASLQAMLPQFEQIEERIKEMDSLVLAAEGERSKQEAGFVWSQFNREDDESLELHLEQIQRNQEILRKLEGDIQSAEHTLTELEKDLQKYQSVIEKLQAERETSSIDFQAQVKALKRVSFESYQDWEEARLRRVADDKRASHRQIEDTYRTQNDRIQRARENAAKLKGRIQELNKQESNLAKGLATLNQELEQKITASQFANLQALREILSHNWNVETAKNEIRNFHQSLHTESEKLGDMKAEAEGKSFEIADFEALEAGVLAQQKIVADLQIALGSLQNDLTRLEKDWQRKKSLQKEYDKLDTRRENLKVLRNLFYSSGFVNYVSTIYLENLCRAANERFMRLTRGSLRLEKSPHNNTFDVIDQLNGGRRRSVKTLSGGQTFQASLCLALALADQVQHQAEAKQNFFFLDEGFGSQDKNSLSIIFETLKSLRKENRIIGLISHVEELQQEIGAYLHIHNDPELGSQIQASWN